MPKYDTDGGAANILPDYLTGQVGNAKALYQLPIGLLDRNGCGACSEVDNVMDLESSNRLKRSVKTYFLMIPMLVFFVSLCFGLIHHFYRYSWAGDIFYGATMLFIVVILLEALLITITK